MGRSIMMGWVLVCLGFATACGASGGGVNATGGASGAPGASAGAAGSLTQGGSGGAPVDPCAASNLKPGDVGPHGLRLLHQTGLLGEASGIGIAEGYFYYRAGETSASSHLYRASVSTLAEEDLGVAKVYFSTIVGSSLIEFRGDAAPGDITSTPLGASLGVTKTLASAQPSPHRFASDATNLYFVAEDSSGIWRLPLAGGTPTLVAPGVAVDDIVVHGTSLYWLDGKSQRLARVPLAGGVQENLVPVFFGGPTVGDDSGIYWGDTSRENINQWKDGAAMSTELAKGTQGDSPERLALDGNDVYWTAGFVCGTLNRVGKDGTGFQLVVGGFSQPYYVGLAPARAFVVDSTHVYAVDR